MGAPNEPPIRPPLLVPVRAEAGTADVQYIAKKSDAAMKDR